MLGNSLIFLIAGYDSTGLTLSYAFWHLATNPDIQKNLQDEIDSAFEKEEEESSSSATMLSYYSILGMKYLDMVLQETLRMHPPFPSNNRQCTTDYTIPGMRFLKIDDGYFGNFNLTGASHCLM